MKARKQKPVEWMVPSRARVKALPKDVRDDFGFALHEAQRGGKHRAARPLRGFKGVLEVVSDHRGDTYRAVYTVRFSAAIYVLHAFQKKSRKGAKTPKKEMDLVKQRLREASEHYEDNYGRKN